MPVDKKRSIGIAAKEVGVQEYVIRFWETQFPDFIKPSIGAGGRRYYYDSDIDTLLKVKKYLYDDGYTIKGLQNLLKSKKVLEKTKKGYANFTDVSVSDCDADFEQKQVLSTNNCNLQPANNQVNQLLKNKLNEFKNHLLNFSIRLENI